MRTKSTTVKYSVVVNCPVDHLWNFLIDFNNMPKWARGVDSILEISPGPVRVGTKVTDVGLGLKRHWPETFWVDEFDDHKKIGLVWKGSYGTAYVRYTLDKLDEGVRLTGDTFGDYRFPFVIILLFMSRTANSNFQAGLNNIKNLAEQSYATAVKNNS